MVTAAGHSHRSTTKHSHKSFKSRFASKGALKAKSKGKSDENPGRKTPHQQVLSKLERRNKARQIAANKHRETLRAEKIFDGRRGAPRIVAVIPLSEDCNAADAVRKLNASLDIDVEVPESGIFTVGVERFKQKVQYVMPRRREFLDTLDACKLADFVVFILSANQEVDGHGESLLRGIEGQGISNVITVVQHLDTVEPAKRRPDVKKSLLSYIKHFFPTEAKVHSLDTFQEAQNALRSLCTQHPRGVNWRDARSYLLAEEVRWDVMEGLIIGGTVRGRGLKADRLVHIQGYGDFRIKKICAWPQGDSPKAVDSMAIDSEASIPEVLEVPTPFQDDLAGLAEEDVMRDADDTTSVMSIQPKGVLLDDHHYYEEKEDERYVAPRRLPKGTSSYQAAWILDEDYDEEEYEDEGDEDIAMDIEEYAPRPEDGDEGIMGDSKSTYAPTEFDSKSVRFLDPSPEEEADQIAAFRNREKDASDDREFPDEIELPSNVLARERLLRYRGLKSLRSSKWEIAPDVPHQPTDWPRLARIKNYKATKARALDEALVGGVPAGTRVRVYLQDAPQKIATDGKLIALYSILRHEHKLGVVTLSILPNSEVDLASEPLKSKDPLILQYGHRRMVINPLYSQGTPGTAMNNVYKFEKYLQPARASYATIIAPLMFGAVPALFYRQAQDGGVGELIATGTLCPAQPEPPIITKRIVLTGHPFKIHKRTVTVRFMFFNKEDINWFKPIRLVTSRGRSGFISESLGTHGWFKARFDGTVMQNEAVGMSLYKRMWPREASEFQC